MVKRTSPIECGLLVALIVCAAIAAVNALSPSPEQCPVAHENENGVFVVPAGSCAEIPVKQENPS